MLKNRKGFTLIELLIVVVIIGILAAIAIPKFANTKDKAKLASVKTDLRNLVSAQESYFSTHGKYSTNAADADLNASLSQGNLITSMEGIGTDAGSGFRATIENATISTNPKACTVYVGDPAKQDGAIECGTAVTP
jgi:type IV pilus assembly protein PilA